MEDKKIIISSLIWKYLERIGYQGIQFIVSIVLARLLLPSDYGAITMITVFIAICESFVQTGFSTSLIQKKGADDLDFSSVFFSSLVIAIVLYLILFISSPFIANFYNMPIICPVLRVLSLGLIIGSVNSVQTAKITKEMKFKKLFYSNLVAVLFSGTIGITFAYYGYGVWALVAQQLVFNFVSTVILFFTSGWKPKWLFSFARIKSLLSYGWKILGSSLLDTLYRNVYNLVIGKKFSSETLGLYNKGEQIPKLVTVNVDGAISSVMLPAYSKRQDDKEKLQKMVKRSITIGAFILFPLMFGLIATAKQVVLVLLTEKWLGAVYFMQLLSIVYLLYPIDTANLVVIKALGHSDYYLKMEIIKKIWGMLVLVLSVSYGIKFMTVCYVLASFVTTIINAYPNGKLLNYGFIKQFKDILPMLFVSLIMFVCVYLIGLINLSPLLLLIIQIISGGIIYVGLSILLKIEPLMYLYNTLKDLFRKKVVKA